MLTSERVQFNGKEYKRTYSTEGLPVRCGKKRYVEAVDLIDAAKVYFEEGAENSDEAE